MELGLSSPLKHKTPTEWARQMKRHGCGAVVFPVNYLAGESVIQAYQEAAERENLIIAEVGVWNNVLDYRGEERMKAVEYAIGQLRMADRIGAKCCVNVAGTPRGTRFDGACRENFEKAAWDQTVQSIQYIIDEAQPIHTDYCIETMPWMIPNGPGEYRELLVQIDRKHVGVHLDIVNMITTPHRYFFQEEFMTECFHTLRGRIRSCHLKDIHMKREYTFQLEETACGKGELNIELFRKLVDVESIKLPVIIEHLNDDQEYIDSLAYVQERLGLSNFQKTN